MANKPKEGADINPNIDNAQEQAAREVAEKAAQEQADRETAEKADAAAKVADTSADDKVSAAVIKAGKTLLKNNPRLSAVYMTADGMGFFEKHDAQKHAHTLINKSVISVDGK